MHWLPAIAGVADAYFQPTSFLILQCSPVTLTSLNSKHEVTILIQLSWFDTR